MKMLYDPMQAALSVVKAFEACLFIFAAKKIMSYDKYIVNRIFAINFILWAVYLICDALVMTFGIASPEVFRFVNIVYKLQLVMAVANAMIIYRVSEIILRSEMDLNKKRIAIRVLIVFIVSLVLFLNVHLGVIDRGTGNMIPLENLPTDLDAMIVILYHNASLSFVTVPIPIIIYFLAVYKISRVCRSETNYVIKRRMIRLLLGLILIMVGYVWFFLTTLLVKNLTIGIRIVGHLFWTASPILIVSSYTKKEFNEMPAVETPVVEPDEDSQD